MHRNRVETGAYVLALVLALGYLVAGIGGWIGDVTDGGSDLAFWLVFLLGGAVLILVGLFGVPRWSAASVALLAIGALAGALALFWTIVVPVLALVLVALAIATARRGRAAAT